MKPDLTPPDSGTQIRDAVMDATQPRANDVYE
jgi:hypothetical protein